MGAACDHGKGSQTTVLSGTMGYMAPECFVTGKASKESDVYSFGIVALEICCGRRAVEAKVEENQIRLVEWVWDLYGVGNFLKQLIQDCLQIMMSNNGTIDDCWSLVCSPGLQCSSFNEASN
ncbi:L-type lectin-domain containing receptor kinase IX.1 [Vitis vinifera]|uniref:L-type lectin-domain containing receptor kinase IX.1 n=1 Tax=Vitis vinifera TaxID=29760 RepID=A0A438FSF7_VITVI|nr:L-type lectin-domain containing receptor kinase IX.1 [Vitis vinifera]